jgi:hypothetical protein
MAAPLAPPGRDPNRIPVKITLNDSIPEGNRPMVEELVKTFVKSPQIVWLPSRFPRYVMFIEPSPNDAAEPENGSIFESPQSGKRSLSSVTNFLEDRIKLLLTAKRA